MGFFKHKKLGDYSKQLTYPPVNKGIISWIYPWEGFIHDHLLFIYFFLLSIFKNTPQWEDKSSTTINKFFCGRKIYLLDSGRSAIAASLYLIGIKPEDEIILTAFNCPAVVDAIYSIGARPKFIDCNLTGGIDLSSALNEIDKKTKAILVTHVFGIIDNLEQISKFCKQNNLLLINDLAQSYISIDNNSTSNFGDICIFSYGSEKHIFALGGGILQINNNKLDRDLSNVITNKVSSIDLLLTLLDRWKYYLTFFVIRNSNFLSSLTTILKLTLKFNTSKSGDDITSFALIIPKLMHPLQKVILASKIYKYNTIQQKSIRNFQILQTELTKYKLLHNPNQLEPYLYATIRVDNEDRFKLSEYLSKNGVATVWNYLPLFKYRAYKKYREPGLKNTERLWREVLSIPFRYPLTEKDIHFIAYKINSFTS